MLLTLVQFSYDCSCHRRFLRRDRYEKLVDMRKADTVRRLLKYRILASSPGAIHVALLNPRSRY